MSVVLPNASLAVRKKTHPFERDAHGVPIAPADGGPFGLSRPGAVTEQSNTTTDHGTEWSLRVDPADWPLEKGDHITDGARVWVVNTAKIHAVPGVPDVDYIAVTAVLEPPKVP